METINQCPVCGHNKFDPYLECIDYLVSNQTFFIQQCQECTFRFTNPYPDSAAISDYYKSEQYISHNDKGKGLINSVYRLVRSYTLESKKKLINKLSPQKGQILDVGCGTGSFLETCQQVGWQVMGVEPDAEARSIAEKKLTIDIKSNLTELPPNQAYDIISLWHVLEHIPNLNTTIQQFSQLLSEAGTLLIAVPNSDSYDARYFKQYWAAYDVPRHLHHFTPQTIECLFKKHGLLLIDKQPMVFDAFYIAMLSTRYQTGKTNYLKSIQIGVKSNLEARQTGNSSSLIYMFKKG